MKKVVLINIPSVIMTRRIFYFKYVVIILTYGVRYEALIRIPMILYISKVKVTGKVMYLI